MKKTFSIYEAKARFSEIVRMVREQHQTVTLSYRGEPVAEIRPIERAPEPIGEKLQRLELAGALTKSTGPADFPVLATRPGALQRFLDERD